MMDEGEDRVKASYGENYKQLSSIKKNMIQTICSV
jgi:hypothetical protein